MRPLKAIYALIPGVVIAAALIPPTASATTVQGFTVSGSQILKDGQPWTPKGFTLSTFQDGSKAWASNEYATITAQMNAIAGAWHGNTIRLQVEQDEYLYGGDGHTAADFQSRVKAAIAYAESIGLAVVLNDQTEQQNGLYSHNEPLPTKDTLTFWQAMEPVAKDPRVILDPFNEPRYFPYGDAWAGGGWNQWFSGTGSYIGYDTLIKDVRSDGYTNQIWAEAPGNYALTWLGANQWPKWKLTDPDSNLVYSYHHTEVDMNAVPTITGFNVQFGNLVTQRGLAVVDGEWTNRSVPTGTGGTPYKPSGDVGQCWGNAPVSVPVYLNYLKARHIGMTVWTLGPDDAPYGNLDYINADGDKTLFSTANNYSHWAGCVTPKGAATSGAGQDVMNWFASISS